jgi:hypothetical protein
VAEHYLFLPGNAHQMVFCRASNATGGGFEVSAICFPRQSWYPQTAFYIEGPGMPMRSPDREGRAMPASPLFGLAVAPVKALLPVPAASCEACVWRLRAGLASIGMQ